MNAEYPNLKFPILKEDESFEFEAVYKSNTSVNKKDLEIWVKEWMSVNKDEKVFDRTYMEEFVDLPEIETKKDQVILKFNGKPSDEKGYGERMWKDWFVKFTQDFVSSSNAIKEFQGCKK